MQFQKKIRIVFLLIFITFPLAKSFSQEVMFEKSVLKYAIGDNIEWSSSDYNDDDWNIVYFSSIPFENTNLWIRTNFYSDVIDNQFDQQHIFVDITATYELFWNGIFIGNNCISGSDIKLDNGQFSKRFDLPDSLIFNVNTLALRIIIEEGKDIEIADLTVESKSWEFESDFYIYGSLLILFFVHLIFLYFYFNNSLKFDKLQRFYFGLLLISIVLTIVHEVFLYVGTISYHHNYIIFLFEFYQDKLLLIGITLFFFKEFEVKNSLLYVLAVSVVIITLIVLKEYFLVIYITGFIPSILLLIWAAISKKVFALQSLTSILIIFLMLLLGIVFRLIDLSFLVFPAFVTIRKIRLEDKKTKELYQSTLKSVRLETEMLKKILQPHYIMNSLNSVLEWIEESPKKGLKFIEELTNEFRSFLEYSSKKLITVEEELELCRNHLKIMEYRQLKEYKLISNIKDLKRKIPPTIFHTLVENGITHNTGKSEKICFLFDEEYLQNRIVYRIIIDYNSLHCDGTFPKELISSMNMHTKIIYGTGLKYIKSRLQECYGNDWKLNLIKNENYWVTEIEIYYRANK